MTNEMKQNPFFGTTCLLVEDHAPTQVALTKMVETSFTGVSVRSFSNLRAVQKWLEEAGADELASLKIALIDLGLPDGSGIDLIRKIKELACEVMNIVVTIYDDDARLFGALTAGAYGYLLKSDDPSTMKATFSRIAAGEPPLSPSIAHRLLAHFHHRPNDVQDEIPLSPREGEILTLIARGHTVPEAAGLLGLSAQTVAGYVKNIYQKLHISSRAEATREAFRLGLA